MMNSAMSLLLAIKSLYAANGIVSLLLYLPQVVRAARGAGDGRSLSLVTFGGWGIGSVITCLYAVLTLHDPLFALVSLGNVIGSGTIFALVLFRRLSLRRTLRPS